MRDGNFDGANEHADTSESLLAWPQKIYSCGEWSSGEEEALAEFKNAHTGLVKMTDSVSGGEISRECDVFGDYRR